MAAAGYDADLDPVHDPESERGNDRRPPSETLWPT